MAAGLRRMGVCEADIEAAQTAQVDAVPARADFEVHDDVWESLLFFLRVQRQWVFVPVTRVVGMGAAVVDARRWCLNWPGIESVVRLCGLRRAKWAALVDDLAVIEAVVLKAESEARAVG